MYIFYSTLYVFFKFEGPSKIQNNNNNCFIFWRALVKLNIIISITVFYYPYGAAHIFIPKLYRKVLHEAGLCKLAGAKKISVQC